MRVLFLNYEFPPLGGGAGQATLNILKQFARQKDLQIDLITSSPNNAETKKIARNINVHALDIGKDRKNIHLQSQSDLLKYSWKAFWFARNLRKQKRYDLIHAFFGIPGGFLAMFLGIPYIVSLRGSDVPFYSNKYKLLDLIFFRNLSRYFIWHKAKAVIANSDGLRQLAWKSSPKQKISVIPNGVDIKKFYPDTVSRNRDFTILYNSRFTERKGIKYLIDAFIPFNRKYPETRLITMSSGNLENEMKGRVKKAGITKQVNFLGYLDPSTAAIAENYRRCHVFILPSLNEGMSNSLLEALASGLPVVVTDTGGTKELVNNDNGILIPMKSSEAIYEALEKIYKNRQAVEDMGKKSREVAERMSWGNTANLYLQLYKYANQSR